MTEPSFTRWSRASRADRNDLAVRAYKHPNPGMLAEVAAGLSTPQKELPPKYFYDHRGSELFEEITRLPEYYQTRTERGILESWMPELIAQLGTRALVELGAGNAEKSRIILTAMRGAGTADVYVPIDVSATFLNQTATQLKREYPGLTVEPIISDFAENLERPSGLPDPALYAFLGGTIGNFYPPAAIRLLARIRAAMRIARPSPVGCRPAEGRGPHRESLQRFSRCHGGIQPQHAAGVESGAGLELRSSGIRALCVL